MIRRLLLGSFAVSFVVCVYACTQETGPGAPKRTSGCIDETCAPTTSSTTSSSSSSGSTPEDAGADASEHDAS